MEFYDKDTPFPGPDGVFQPSRKQAEILMQGKENLDATIPKEIQKEIFEE